jgi:hypothetical protein
MSARDRLFDDIWDMRSAKEKNALIDAALAEHAHGLAEKIRTTVLPTAITPGGPYINGVTWAADLIDPLKDEP